MSVDAQKISPNDVADFPPPTPFKIKQQTGHFSALKVNVRSTDSDDIDVFTPRATDEQVSYSSFPVSSRFHSDFEFLESLGTGAFGSVSKVRCRLDGQLYAVKSSLQSSEGLRGLRGRQLKEVYALAKLSTQVEGGSIVRYHNAWIEEGRLFIQTELCDGSLNTMMKESKERMEVKGLYTLLRSILLALQLLHR